MQVRNYYHCAECGREAVSLVCGELIEARGLAVVLRQAATAAFVEEPEIGLPACVSLVCGELVEARGLAVVLRQAATGLVPFRTPPNLPKFVT